MILGLLGVLAPVAAGAIWMLALTLPPGPAPSELGTYPVVGVGLVFSLFVIATPWLGRMMGRLFLRDVEVRALIRYGILMRRFRQPRQREWGHGFLMARRLTVLDRVHRSALWKTTLLAVGAFLFASVVVPPFDRQTPGPTWCLALIVIPCVVVLAWPIVALYRDTYRVRERLYSSLLVHRWTLVAVPLLAIWYRSFCHDNPGAFADLRRGLLASIETGGEFRYPLALALTLVALLVYFTGVAAGAVMYFGYVMHAARLPPGILQRLVR